MSAPTSAHWWHSCSVPMQRSSPARPSTSTVESAASDDPPDKAGLAAGSAARADPCRHKAGGISTVLRTWLRRRDDGGNRHRRRGFAPHLLPARADEGGTVPCAPSPRRRRDPQPPTTANRLRVA